MDKPDIVERLQRAADFTRPYPVEVSVQLLDDAREEIERLRREKKGSVMKQPIKVIVAGGRDFWDYQLLEDTIFKLYDSYTNEEVTIISGGARGADSMGAAMAERHGLGLVVINAQWNRYGKSAGYRRNVEMAEVADELVAFWDGSSKGTGHMIDIAREKGLNVHVIPYGGDWDNG